MILGKRMFTKNSIERWDEAIPIGNAKIGALVWGNSKKLRISLDKDDIWDLRQSDEISHPDFNVENLKKLIAAKDAAQIKSRFENFYENYPYPTKLPVGAIEITPNQEKKINFDLNMEKGVLCVGLGGQKFEIITHSVTKHLYIFTKGEDFEIKLIPPNYCGKNLLKTEEKRDALELLGYKQCEYTADENFQYFVQPTYGDKSYCVMLAKKTEGENISYALDVILTNGNAKDSVIKLKNELKQALLHTSKQINISQTLWWKNFWAKSNVTLGEKEYEDLYNLYNYYLGCLSDETSAPIALQGIWTADDGGLPPWKGDYHTDLNLEMTYWSYLKSNRIEQGKSLINYLQKTWGKAREFSKKFFHCENGACLCGTLDFDGNPMGGWSQYTYSLTNQSWLCYSLFQYYEYTEDEKLLKDFIYPYIKESAECLISQLRIENGTYKLIYSTSPEINNNWISAWLIPNSNYDLALMKTHFYCLVELSKIVCKSDEKHWQKYFDNFEDFHKKNNVLKIDSNLDYLESHRHLSHAIGIYPLPVHTLKITKEVINDTIKQIESKGYDWWVGFSFVWMSNIIARSGNGDEALKHLKIFKDCFVSPNGFNLNGDYKKQGISNFNYRPFTLETNFAFISAVNEMLLQDYDEIIEVMPAISVTWDIEKVSFFGLKVRGNLQISAKYIDKRLHVTLQNLSKTVKKRTVKYGKMTAKVDILPQKSIEIIF